MKTAVRKVAATALALLVSSLPVLLSARERRGADLVVAMKDGQAVTGELIAVKHDSLLLLNPAGKDESVDIAGVREIKMVKKSQALKGGLYGLLTGAALGVVVYLAAISGKEKYIRDDYPPSGVWPLIFAAPAGLLGLGVGVAAGFDKTLRLEGMSDSVRKRVLADLRAHSRMPDFK